MHVMSFIFLMIPLVLVNNNIYYFLAHFNIGIYIYDEMAYTKMKLIANEQPREEARLQGGSLIEPCEIVPGGEKISNRCNIE